jgi:hypothetical protein
MTKAKIQARRPILFQFLACPLNRALFYLVADDFLLTSAPKWQLNRLRKDQLSRLYELAGFDDANDVERFTKSDLVNGILSSVGTIRAHVDRRVLTRL